MNLAASDDLESAVSLVKSFEEVKAKAAKHRPPEPFKVRADVPTPSAKVGWMVWSLVALVAFALLAPPEGYLGSKQPAARSFVFANSQQ